MASTAAATSTNHLESSYLTLVPRGLHRVFVDRVRQQFQEAGHCLHDISFVGERGPRGEEKYGKHLTELLSKSKKQYSTRIGTVVEDGSSNKHVSVGYDEVGRLVWSCGGTTSAIWVNFITDAPVHFVGSQVRCIGPLLASVQVWNDIDISKSGTLDQVKAWIPSLDFSLSNLDQAVKVWHEHVQDAWPLSQQEVDELQKKIQGDIPLKFRISCLRVDSKQYAYPREDFVRAIADHITPSHWKVDLTDYDVEVVLLVKANCLAMGLSLRPYRHLGTKCFSPSAVPPDVTTPILSSDVLSGLVRLRPTTAQLLYQLLELSPGDVVLDPCAGIGTIPLEAPPGAVGIGGDLFLNSNVVRPVAADYLKRMQQHNASCVSDLLAWDAALLPLRAACVDGIVSDLPFGQRCLSAAKLDGLLPLLLGEMGRVLRPDTGCMVLLCGSIAPVLNALEQLNSIQPDGDVWHLPCQAVIPVNIGGLMAWTVKVRRGPAQSVLVEKHAERVRKLVSKRERVERHRRSNASHEPIDKHRSKYRRLQS